MHSSPSEATTETYARFFQRGMSLVTWRTLQAEPILRHGPAAHLLRSVLHGVRSRHPFQLAGFVFLPDHLHLLMRVRDGATVADIVARAKRDYQRDYAQMVGTPGEVAIWLSGHEVQPIGDVAAFAEWLDQIHYDPVYHGWVNRPEEWQESSYERWIERGLYKLGWGWHRPQRLASDRHRS